MTDAVEAEIGNGLLGTRLIPARPSDLGVIVLSGSSGSVDVSRAALFAHRGAHAIALRWFGGPGQPPGVCEVPLETFDPAIARLKQLGCHRVALLGTSKGAEAALLAAVRDPRIDVVIGLSPSSVVWANSGVGKDGNGWPLRSSFTDNDVPLPFVPYDVANLPTSAGAPVSYLGYHLSSLAAHSAEIDAAAIAIERARAHVILGAGGNDQLWPSVRFAEELARRRRAADRSVDLITDPDAGHRLLLPSENTPRSILNAHGGSDEADRRCGHAVWRAIASSLGFGDIEAI